MVAEASWGCARTNNALHDRAVTEHADDYCRRADELRRLARRPPARLRGRSRFTNLSPVVDDFDGKVLDGTYGAVTPFFSPDGQWIGFVSGAMLKKVSVSGGSPLSIGDVSAVSGLTGPPTWLGDDTIVWTTQSGELYRISANGAHPAQLSPSLKGRAIRHPYFAAGTNLLLFGEADPNAPIGPPSPGIFALDLRSHAVVSVSPNGSRPQYLATGHLLYAEGAALVAAPFDPTTASLTGTPVRLADDLVRTGNGPAWFGSSPSGTVVYALSQAVEPRQLVWVDRKGVELETVRTPMRSFEQPRISPDSTRIALSIRDSTTQDVGVLDPVRGPLRVCRFQPAKMKHQYGHPTGHVSSTRRTRNCHHQNCPMAAALTTFCRTGRTCRR